MKPVSTFVVLLVIIPSVLNRAIPQETVDVSDTANKSSTEKDIDIETTTVIPDLAGGDSSSEDTSSSSTTEDISFGSSSTTEETLPSSRRPSWQKPYSTHHHFDDDYDMFLDHLNRTSQVKLELIDRTLKEVEKELRPGTPLMKVVDWVLNLFTQLQNNNNRRQKPNNGQAH